MTDQNIIKLENIDPEDFNDILLKIEKSFGFSFGENDLKGVKTFGDLRDTVKCKINLIDSHDCTTQQAFYKIRDAIVSAQLFEKDKVIPETELQIIFPRKNRRAKVKQFQKELGVDMDFLGMKTWLALSIAVGFISSLIAFFFSWKVPLVGLAAFIIIALLAKKLSKELSLSTVKQLSEKLSREHYTKSRRNVNTVNRKEISKMIEQMFINDFDLEPVVLTRDAPLGWE